MGTRLAAAAVVLAVCLAIALGERGVLLEVAAAAREGDTGAARQLIVAGDAGGALVEAAAVAREGDAGAARQLNGDGANSVNVAGDAGGALVEAVGEGAGAGREDDTSAARELIVAGTAGSGADVTRRELDSMSMPLTGGCRTPTSHRYRDWCYDVARVSDGSPVRVSSWQEGLKYCKALGSKLAEPPSYVEEPIVHNLCKAVLGANQTIAGCWIGLTQQSEGVTCSSGQNPPSLGAWVRPSDCRPAGAMWRGGTPSTANVDCAYVGDRRDNIGKNTELLHDAQCSSLIAAIVCQTPADPEVDPNAGLCNGGNIRYARESCFGLEYAWQGVPWAVYVPWDSYRGYPERFNSDQVSLMLAMAGSELIPTITSVWLGANWTTSGWRWARANALVTDAEVKAMGPGFKLPSGGDGQCLVMRLDGTLDQARCDTFGSKRFMQYPAAGLDCGKLVADQSCDCGEVRTLVGGTVGCVPAPAGLRYSTARQARGAASCLASGAISSSTARSALYYKHLSCLSGERALGVSNLAEPRAVLDALTALVLLTAVPVTNPQEQTIVSSARAMQVLYQDFLDNESAFCVTACPCDQVPQVRTTDQATPGIITPRITCGTIAGQQPTVTDLVRKQLMCEASLVRGPAPGVLVAHALGCISTQRATNRTRALVSDIGAAASLSLSRTTTGPTALLQTVIGVALSAALGGDGAGLSSFGSVPWIKAGFWASEEFTTIGNKISALQAELTALKTTENMVNARETLNNIQQMQGGLVMALANQSSGAVGVVEAQLSSAALNANDAATKADSALANLNEVLELVQGASGKGGGSLGRVSDATQRLIDAQTNVAKKELEVKRRMAIFNFVTSALSLVANCVTFGAASALKAGAITAKAAERMDKAAKLASQGSELAGRSTDTLFPGGRVAGPLETTFRDMGGLLPESAQDVLAATPAGDLIAIADSISVFAAYSAELAAIESDAQAKGAQATAAIAEIRSVLSRLSSKAAALSLAMFSAAVWARSDSVDVADTRLAPELLEAVGLWQTATKRIITLMVSDFKLCPGQADRNPYRSALSRLPVNVSDNNSSIGSPTYPDSLSSPTAEPGGRLLALRLAPQSPAPFARSLGAKDTDAEREAAAKAWDSLAHECSGFFDNLEDVARWGAETQNYIFAAVKAVRLVIVTKVQLRAAGATKESFDMLIKGAPAEGTGASLAIGSTLDSKISSEDFDRASSQATTRAILYVRVSSMLAIARALLADLCTSLAYSNPSDNIAAFINGASKGRPAFNIDGRCFVSSAANTTVDPVNALGVLFDPDNGLFGSSNNNPLYQYRKAVINNLEKLYSANSASSQGSYVKSCAVPHAGFVKSLLQRGGLAVIDVTPESFAADNMLTNTDCMVNAEVRKVRLVFRAADGGILPRAGSAIEVQVLAFNSASSSFFKYTETPTGIIEHAYTAPLRRKFDYMYKGTSATGECDTNFVPVLVGSQGGGGKFCAKIDPSDSADAYKSALERLPVFGRWEFQLGVNSWPANVEEPVSVTLMFDLASACAVQPTHRLSMWSDAVRSPGRSANQNMLGRVCGGQDFARFAAPDPALDPPSGSNLAVILGAVSSVIFLIAATAAVIIKGRNSRRALGPKASAVTSSAL